MLSREFSQYHLGEKYFELSLQPRQKHERDFYKALYVPCGEQLSDVEDADEDNDGIVGESLSNQSSAMEDMDISHISLQGISHSHQKNLSLKVNDLVSNKKIKSAFKEGDYFVISTTNRKPHHVEQSEPGRYTCDKDDMINGCLYFKQSKTRAHVLACAVLNDDLQNTVDIYHSKGRGDGSYNLTNIAMHNIKRGAGRKSGTVRHRTKRGIQGDGCNVNTVAHISEASCAAPKHIKMTITQGNGTSNVTALKIPEDHYKSYKLTRLSDHRKVKTCAGCKRQFVRTTVDASHNLCLQRKEQPTWVDGEGIMRKGRYQAVYYHLSNNCVIKNNANFQSCDVDFHPLLAVLTQDQKTYLNKQMLLNV